MARGYRREVDAFLDDIITDYQKMADMNSEVVKLSEENNKLKRTGKLRLRVATSRPQDNKSFASGSANSNNNNVDILKEFQILKKLYLVNKDILLLRNIIWYNRKSDILGNRYSNIEESPCSHNLR